MAGGRKIPDEVLARAVAEALRLGNHTEVARRHNISVRSLSRAMVRAKTDPLLAHLTDQKGKTLDERGWADEAVEFLREAIAKARELVGKADDVKQLRAVMGAIKIVGDLQTVREAFGGEQPDADQQGSKASPTPRGSGGTPSRPPGGESTEPRVH